MRPGLHEGRSVWVFRLTGLLMDTFFGPLWSRRYVNLKGFCQLLASSEPLLFTWRFLGVPSRAIYFPPSRVSQVFLVTPDTWSLNGPCLWRTRLAGPTGQILDLLKGDLYLVFCHLYVRISLVLHAWTIQFSACAGTPEYADSQCRLCASCPCMIGLGPVL